MTAVLDRRADRGPEPEPEAGRGRRRPWLVLLALAVVLAGGLLLLPGGDGEEPAGAAAPTSTETVIRQDLVVTETLDGELGFGDRRPVTSGRSGVVTAVAEAGTVLPEGGTLFAVDLEPTVVLTGAVPSYRALDTDAADGADVQQLEARLVALGFGDDLTVDEEFTAATAAAVEAWEDSLGRADPDGRVELGDLLFAAEGVRVAQVTSYVGAPVQTGGQVLETTSTTKVVEVALDADRTDAFPAGTAVGVELPDGQDATGTVLRVGTEPEADAADPAAEPTVPLVVTLDDPAAAGAFDGGSVDVTLESDRDEAVLTVPVTALVALAEGGYAVERVTPAGSELVAVSIGTVTDELVAVEGELVEGDVVVVPA